MVHTRIRKEIGVEPSKADHSECHTNIVQVYGFNPGIKKGMYKGILYMYIYHPDGIISFNTRIATHLIFAIYHYQSL